MRARTALAWALTAHTVLNVRLLRPAVGSPSAQRVSVVIPARDEERQVAACVRTALAQAGVREVLVVDDGSSDGTASRVPAGARVLPAGPVPAGWRGKPWACAVGAAAADDPDVLVFLDADVRLLPGGLARSVATLRATGSALVSPYPRLVADSPLERLVQPLLPWSWLTFLPLRLAERRPRPSLAAAGGQLLLVDAAAYRRVGGHGAVRGAVVEDLALARAFARAGLRGGVVDGSDVATCRMYAGTRAVVDGWSRTLPHALHPAVPFVLTWLSATPGAAAAGVVGRAVTARRTGGSVGDALAHPLSLLALDALTAVGWWRQRHGTNSWKGRPV